MKLGAEPKKLAVLAGLLLVSGYFIITSLFPSQPAPAPAARRTQPLPEVGRPVPRSEARPSSPTSSQEFRPSLKPAKEGVQADLASIDATLRLDLLAKLAEVKLSGGERSLFEFASAPLPKTPEPKIIPKPLQPVALPQMPPQPPEAEGKPVAPPITLKFFGYTTASRQGNRRAFFLDGDEILVASEGDVLKKRYRVVRIGVNSVVMEDIEFKAEQTLPLEPQAG